MKLFLHSAAAFALALSTSAQLPLHDASHFGRSVVSLGDLDGNGRPEVAIGSPNHNSGSGQSGAVWILELDEDGALVDFAKISDVDGGFGGGLVEGDEFGTSLASADLNGDGRRELFVGAPGNAGAVWVCFLNADGSVASQTRIGANAGGFTAFPAPTDRFGFALGAIGDLDGDGIDEVAVGAPSDDDGGIDHGAVWILFMNANGTVASHAKISELFGGFVAAQAESEFFGEALTGPGDIDGDGKPDLVVGAPGNDDGTTLFGNRGAVHVLNLAADGSVAGQTKISHTSGDLPIALADGDRFGAGLASTGDLDGDGVGDLVVGYTDFPTGYYFVFLESDGTVKDLVVGTLPAYVGSPAFGRSFDFVGDLDGDTRPELVIGNGNDSQFGPTRGAAWTLFFDAQFALVDEEKLYPLPGFEPGAFLSATKLALPRGPLGPHAGDRFGAAAAAVGDLDGDGVLEVAVGAPGDDDLGPDSGAVWILSIDNADNVIASAKISAASGGFTGFLGTGALFGAGLAAAGDVDGDGVEDLWVGAPRDGLHPSEGQVLGGALWLLYLNADGTVREHKKIAAGVGGLSSTLNPGDHFGRSVVNLGDVDGNGVSDLAVGTPEHGNDIGRVWTLFMNADGSVSSDVVASTLATFSGHNGFGTSLSALGDFDGNGVPDFYVGSPLARLGTFNAEVGRTGLVRMESDGTGALQWASFGSGTGAHFGTAVATVGDLDLDGVVDVASGMPGFGSGLMEIGAGAVSVVTMQSSGVPKSTVLTDAETAPGELTLAPGDEFGASLATLGDLDGDGIPELLVGATGDDNLGREAGAVWILRVMGIPAPPATLPGTPSIPVAERASPGHPAARRTSRDVFSPGSRPGGGGGSNVLVVDDDGVGVDATDIQAAIDLASEGDRILVRTGEYSSFVIDAKGLSIVAESGAVVIPPASDPAGLVVVRNLTAGQFVLLQGLQVATSLAETPHAGEASALAVEDCAGTLWVQSIDLEGGGVNANVDVANSANVVFTRCNLTALQSPSGLFVPPTQPGPALRVTGSVVDLYDSLIQGAVGVGVGGCHTFTCEDGIPSGHGIEVLSGTLRAFGSVAYGGDGRDGDDECDSFGAGGNGTPGGDGLRILGASAFVESHGSVFLAGAGSLAGSGCNGGAAGVDVDDALGGLVDLPSTPRRLALQAPVVEGDTYRVHFRGEPADSVFAIISPNPGIPLPVPPLSGVLQLGLPLNLLFLGALSSTGGLTVETVASQQASGIGLAFVQMLHVSTLAEAFLGGPTASVVLDGGLP